MWDDDWMIVVKLISAAVYITIDILMTVKLIKTIVGFRSYFPQVHDFKHMSQTFFIFFLLFLLVIVTLL